MRNDLVVSAGTVLAFQGVELREQLLNGPSTVPFLMLAQTYQAVQVGGASFCGQGLASHTPAVRGNAEHIATLSAPL